MISKVFGFTVVVVHVALDLHLLLQSVLPTLTLMTFSLSKPQLPKMGSERRRAVQPSILESLLPWEKAPRQLYAQQWGNGEDVLLSSIHILMLRVVGQRHM